MFFQNGKSSKAKTPFPLVTSRTLTEEFLFPKVQGKSKTHKPKVLVVNSPYDRTTDRSVSYASVYETVKKRGYTPINSCAINFNDEVSHSNIKEHLIQNSHITVWLEAHGVISWLFGAEPSFESELAGVKKFALFIKSIEQKYNATVDAVILNACYSAAELMNEHLYINSPARLLSAALSECSVIGFVSINSTAKITRLYDLKGSKSSKLRKTNIFSLPTKTATQGEPCTLSHIEGSILYRNGSAIEHSLGNANYYIDQKYLKPFVAAAPNNQLITPWASSQTVI